jgi:UDP-galactopyranose mutase
MKFVTSFDLSNYDVIAVGAGLTSSVISRNLADRGKRVLIIEKRNHIGGNLFDYVNKDGILVQKYGPHAFHTNDEEVNEYIHRFTKTKPYVTRCAVFMHEKFTPSPFNFKTIDTYFNKDKGDAIKKALLNEYKGQKEATIVDLLKSNNPLIKNYADFLFKSDYSLYTAKQWGIKPSDIDPSVLKRVPVLFNYDDQYFYDKYQYMPINGFTAFISNVLDSPNIDVVLNRDFFEDFSIRDNLVYHNQKIVNQKVIFSGTIDSFFNYKFGHLPYRSLRFDFKTLNQQSFQDAPITAYPEADGYTRVTEYTKMPSQHSSKTTIAFEYPLQFNGNNEPYYPILTKNSQKEYQLYRNEASGLNNVLICGRLGEFKYYNMDQAIKRALSLFL